MSAIVLLKDNFLFPFSWILPRYEKMYSIWIFQARLFLKLYGSSRWNFEDCVFWKRVNSNQQHIYLSSIFLELNPLLRYVCIFPLALSLYVCNSLAQLIWFFIHYFIKKKNSFALRNPVLRNWRILSLVILAHAMERLRTVYVSISRFKPKWIERNKALLCLFLENQIQCRRCSQYARSRW